MLQTWSLQASIFRLFRYLFADLFCNLFLDLFFEASDHQKSSYLHERRSISDVGLLPKSHQNGILYSPWVSLLAVFTSKKYSQSDKKCHLKQSFKETCRHAFWLVNTILFSRSDPLKLVQKSRNKSLKSRTHFVTNFFSTKCSQNASEWAPNR